MLITLEGIEGSGKTTQIDYIVAHLRQWGREYVVTKEPGGTVIGEKIRAILLDPENRDIDSLTELLLYAADRAQHVRELIKPMLSAGKVVICDRFCDSTTVYQGFTRGMDMDLIRQLNDLVLAGLMPDITYLLDLPPAVGLRRAWNQISDGSRSKSETRFENEKLQFHEQVRKGYLELARRSPDRFVVVDASKDSLEVKKNILRHLEKMLHAPDGTVSA